MIEKSVDIIIPIYNAADDLKICLQSIYKHTDLSRNRLILINDNSTDSHIKEILDSQCRDNVIVIHNQTNQGFSANINKGMSQSDVNDVILLNSDTVVTNRWVEKIQECAYSSQEIGTVTPLSNNATLCSVPVPFEENVVPECSSIDDIAAAVERNSMRKYPQISVAHGFCMFIKREVIERVGYFDAETFGRGYGEENDYCNRLNQLGYINVQCDDTYIFHSGTKSFVSEEKKRYIEEHEAVLRKRYPLQMQENDAYVKRKPNNYIAENIKPFMELRNGKRNLLYVLHCCNEDSDNENIGGTEIHVKHLKDGLKGEYNILVAYRREDLLRLKLYIDTNEYSWSFYIGPEPKYYQFFDRRLRTIWENILDGFAVDIVHIHHLKGLSLDIASVAKERNIPLYYTCHDYFAMCPFLSMLDGDGTIIDFKETSADTWANLLEQKLGIYTGVDYISTWHQHFEEMLSKCDSVIVPSISVEKSMAECFSKLKVPIQVIEHGCDFDKDTVVSDNRNANKEALFAKYPVLNQYLQSEKSDNLKVAFIGGISEIKGGKAIYELIRKSKSDVDWLFFGTMGQDEISDLRQRNVFRFGPYDRNDLPDLMRLCGVDLVCILSICPETFSYTLSEAILCDLPVIVTDVGALGERAAKMDCCKLVPADDIPGKVTSILEEFKVNSQLLEEYKAKAAKQEVKSIDEMILDYEKLYSSLSKQCIREEFDSEFLFKGYMDRTSYSDEEKALVNTELRQSLSDEQLEILNSTTFKIAARIKKINIPFKKKLWMLLNR